MATPADNLFQVTDLLDDGYPVARFANSLRSASLTRPYTGFNGNAGIGTSVRLPYPIIYDTALPNLAYAQNDVDATVVREQNMTVGNPASPTTQLPAGAATKPWTMTSEQVRFFSRAESSAQFRDMYVDSAIQQVGNSVNQSFFEHLELFCPDSIGDPTADLNGLNSTAAANAQLSNMALLSCLSRRGEPAYFAMSPNAYSKLQLPYATYFNEDVNFPILRQSTTKMQDLSGLAAYQDEDVPVHVNGTFDASGAVTVAVDVPLTTSINDDFTLVSLSGFTASAAGVLNVGDLISFGTTAANNLVNQINPQNFRSFENRKTFVIRGNATGGTAIDADGAGDVTVQVFSPIVAEPTDPYRNVDRQVVTGMEVTLIGGANGRYTKNWVFCREGMYFTNPGIASFPLSGSDGKMYSGYPNEMVSQMTVPCSNLELAINVGSQGDFRAFNNEWAVRSIWGFTAMNGFAFSFLSAA